MRKLMNKFDAMLLRAKLAGMKFMKEERGDTNFISIAIILVVVIVIAVLFITLGGDLGKKLEQKIKGLMDALQ